MEESGSQIRSSDSRFNISFTTPAGNLTPSFTEMTTTVNTTGTERLGLEWDMVQRPQL